MPLSPEEQAEFAQLSQKYGQPQTQPQSSGLSPQEQAEFAQLSQKYGNKAQPQNFTANTTTPSTSPTSGPSELQSQTPPMGPRGDAVLMQQYGATHPRALSPAMSVAGGMLMGPPGAIAGAALGSAAANAATNYNQPGTALKNVAEDTAINGVLPEVGGKVLSAAGEGAGRLADWLQQSAMGMKKFTPGAGQAAIDAGVWGTRGMMKNGMAKAVQSAGKAVSDAIPEMQGTVDSKAVADKLREMADDYITTNGIEPEAAKPIREAIESRAQDIEGRGQVTPQDAQDLKQIAQSFGYTPKGTAIERLPGQMAQQEAFGYGEQLAKQNPNYAAANKTYSSLMPGNTALQMNEPLGGLKMRDLFVAGGVGALTHDPVKALTAIAAERALTSPLAQSSAAQGMSGLAKFLQAGGKVSPNLLRAVEASEEQK